MRRGFWGCVADGGLFPGMNIIAGRQKPNAKSKSKQIIKEAHQQLRLAECLVRIFEKVWQKNGLIPINRSLSEADR